MKTFAWLGITMVAAAGCGGAKSMKSVAASPSSGMAAPSVAAADSAGAPAPGATVATDGTSPARPMPIAAAELTAGIWDDNLNYSFFEPYAAKMAAQSQDLAAFARGEQAAAHQQLGQRGQKTELDIQLIVDTTGSMGDEMQYLKSELGTIAQQIKQRFPTVTPRWSLVAYKDRGDEYVTRKFEFTPDLARFQRDLAAQSAGGGGDFPEAVVPAFESGLAQHWRADASVARVVLWVADAPPHPGEGAQFARLVRKARDLDVHVYPIASSGIDDGTEYQMRAAAQLTGGRYIFLTNDSGVGNDHAEPHIPCYSVTYLKDAIIRVIGSELSGRRLTVDPERVVRQVGAPTADGTCTVREQQVVAF
ncbi:MAG TPA: vWA domain-containing protein [Kofleriaceae bacterium]|nr:vWA domain-containing protein [Kofleriaceae bacterium]